MVDYDEEQCMELEAMASIFVDDYAGPDVEDPDALAALNVSRARFGTVLIFSFSGGHIMMTLHGSSHIAYAVVAAWANLAK